MLSSLRSMQPTIRGANKGLDWLGSTVLACSIPMFDGSTGPEQKTCKTAKPQFCPCLQLHRIATPESLSTIKTIRKLCANPLFVQFWTDFENENPLAGGVKPIATIVCPIVHGLFLGIVP